MIPIIKGLCWVQEHVTEPLGVLLKPLDYALFRLEMTLRWHEEFWG